jgi:hypothetical protein
MIGLTWNSEEIRDKEKHLFISKTIREQKLDCIVLLETWGFNFSSASLRHLPGGRDIIWFFLPPRGRWGYTSRV